MATKTVEYNTKPMDYDCYYKPVKISAWEAFRLFLYNPSEGRVFGRTGPSWAKIGLFYLIFYGVLSALFAVCLWVFFQTLDPRIPTWQLDSSIIGTSPGLGFRPMPPESNVESTLIWYNGKEAKNYDYWTKELDKFLAVYKTPGLNPGRGENIFDCDYDKLPGKGQVCNVKDRDFLGCNHDNHYGFDKSRPCIFVKLNRIYNWVPEFYNDTEDLPDNMPMKLKRYISDPTHKKKLNTVWVSCEGENPADVENLGPVNYFPQPGFPGYYYPYENSEGYLSPLVAIEFERPRTGILINIECKAWAHNIRHDRHDRVGMVHLELMVD